VKPKICLIVPNILPVPAVKGGAIEHLMQIIAEENEIEQKARLIIFSIYDPIAETAASQFKFSQFIFIKTGNYFSKDLSNFIIRLLNKIARILFNGAEVFPNAYYKKCFEIIKNENPQFIVNEGAVSNAKFETLLASFKREQLYIHCHSRYKPLLRTVNTFGNVIGISKFVTDYYMQHIRYNDVKPYVVMNCCNETYFTGRITPEERTALRLKLGLNTNDFIVLFCGRIIREKGIRELIEAINRIHNPLIKLLVIGSPRFALPGKTPYLTGIETLVKKSDKRVVFTGYIENSKVSSYYQIADIMAVPSLWEEGFGLVVLEGLSSGLPLIVTRSGGIPEIVSQESAIMLERDKDLVDNLSCGINYLYNNKQMRRSMSEAAIKESSMFSRRKYYHNFISVFNKTNN
jgi:spore coat protein SA